MIYLDDRIVGRADERRSGVWPITLSGDGSAVAMRMAHYSKDEEPKYWLIFQGEESQPFMNVGRPALSRDGRVIAFKATRDDEEWFVRIGERDEPAGDSVTDPVVTPDGSTVAYAGRRNRQWFLKVNGKETPIDGKPYFVFISPDGREAGWVEERPIPGGGAKMRVIASGKTGEAFGLVGTPVFSPTESLVTYGAEEEKRKYVVIGERKIETPNRIGDPVFSPDGRRIGYGSRIGRELWWKILDVSAHR